MNYFDPPSLILTCSEHSKESIVKGCADLKCNRRVLLCQSCLKLDMHLDHQAKLFDMSKFFTYFSQDVSIICKENKQQLDQFVKSEQNRLIYKQINDEQHHLKNFKSQIDNIKTNIAKNIVDLTELFNIEMQTYKDEYQRSLDKFYEEYQQIFAETKNQYLQTFRGALEYYFTNPLVLQNKLLSVDNPEQYLKQLKKLEVTQTQNLQMKVNELCIKAKSLPFVLEEKEIYANFKNSLRSLIENHFQVSIKSNRGNPPPTKIISYQSPSQQKLQELPKPQMARNYSQQDQGFQKAQPRMEKQYSQQGSGQPPLNQRPASSNPAIKNVSNVSNNNPQVFNNPLKNNVESVQKNQIGDIMQKYDKRYQ
ncbi:hypothetical protein pb186bvf_003007 [Paramecium bursaria]